MAKKADGERRAHFEDDFSDRNQAKCPGFVALTFDRGGVPYETLARCTKIHAHQEALKDGFSVPAYSSMTDPASPYLLTSEEEAIASIGRRTWNDKKGPQFERDEHKAWLRDHGLEERPNEPMGQYIARNLAFMASKAGRNSSLQSVVAGMASKARVDSVTMQAAIDERQAWNEERAQESQNKAFNEELSDIGGLHPVSEEVSPEAALEDIPPLDDSDIDF